jgi:hypothetical protein
MAFGSSSKIFTSFVTDSLNRTNAFDLNADSIKVALFGNSGTPDQTVASAATAYNAGQWTSGNEVTATGWTAGGLALSSVTSTFSTNVYTFDAADKAGGATDTVTAAYGVLIYDDTLASVVVDQGICYNAFGGSNSVTSGTFTVVFNASGIFALTL